MPIRISADLRDQVQAPALSKPPKDNTAPERAVLAQWREAQAVCFDVDCTVTQQDSLDLLAEFLGRGDQVAQLTDKAMNGEVSLEEALRDRLRIIDCTPEELTSFIQAYPPTTRLTKGVSKLISALQARGKAVYLISGGFREMILPFARELGIPPTNVFANRINWQVDDETGLVTRMVGFDERELTSRQGGKPAAIAQLREMYPYETIAMVGDGITDLEAVEMTGGADIFIGYGGVVVRDAVRDGADWFVNDFEDLSQALERHQVAFIGSGAWACAAAKLVARNCWLSSETTGEFEKAVRMWVYEEEIGDRKLTDIINERHENVKYLPGVNIGDNIVACPDLLETVQGADVLVFCTPHQFTRDICRQLRGNVNLDAIAISLTKGMRVRAEGPQLISEMVRKNLNIDCSVLMGANIAKDIGNEELSEATIGYAVPANGELFKRLFETPYFYVQLVPDIAGAEMAGTLKNVVALAAGFVDGLQKGPNTKAAIMRAGLNEMRSLAERIYPTVRDNTFFESCGVADLIATCYGGRNRLVAEAYVHAYQSGSPKSFDTLEAELLAGQKLQGVLTSDEVQSILQVRGWEADYPLFTTVNGIVNGQLPPTAITEYKSAAIKSQLQ
ncbi:probable glycerol-3-phosphate dehydrogenase [NAD(+)], cytoplasmic at C-terminar half [Coccomyxa sp. Obi]|nr:probable glycerol-3-phosphate dehydrogenase [NAD(+)], cytoplasmic at C-terminar half [Coccomyxa sp. Obi]